MSIFRELLPKIKQISNTYTKNFNDDLKVAFESLDKFEQEYQNDKSRGREKALKDKIGMTTLQSIIEDDGDPIKEPKTKRLSKSNSSSNRTSTDSNGEQRSKKRSKNEVDDMSSPEVDKRQKRNASVKAQSIISKQVNVNLTAKLRREKSIDKLDKNDEEKTSQAPKSRRRKDEEKENSVPNILAIKVKEERVSLPIEPMDMDVLPLDIVVKVDVNMDGIAMPPPAVPVPKPRRGIAKEKSEESSEDESGKKRTTRTKKQSEAMPPPPVPTRGTRSTRASSRAPRPAEAEAEGEEPPAEARPKRTRAKKKVSISESQRNEVDSTQALVESGSATASPAEKPRPKRTRRGKAASKDPPKPVEPIISPEEEPISQPNSPILQKVTKPKNKGKNNLTSTTIESFITTNSTVDKLDGSEMDKTTVIAKDMDKTTVISKEMDKTVVLSNGVYDHAAVSPENVRNMNETVVIEKCNRDTIVLEKPQIITMNAKVKLERVADLKSSNLTEDNSLLTDDESEQEYTPPRKDIPQTQPSSAVKEKVQQFEELASRVTRTKTRAMAKKEDQTETHTPPDKTVLSAETLTKMNSLIFNGKPHQISSSASKPRAVVPTGKSLISSSTSKLNSLTKHKDAAEDLKTSRITEESARKKKEAMLEAKRELQKRKREEKMAAAAAARSLAERERRAQLESAAREREEKQAHADAGRLERMKEAERKKQELARKVAETEERRKAEESARVQRLADDQRKALAQRRKQIEEQEAMKKEAAIMAREIEKRQKEYIEKQKKTRLEEKMTPRKGPGTPGPAHYAHPPEPVYMADGFQYLNSDEDEADPPPRPVPGWSTSNARKVQLAIQSQISTIHIERLFSVRVHSPDLRDIFPNIERTRLKRTSSAVWRTPPQLRTVVE